MAGKITGGAAGAAEAEGLPLPLVEVCCGSATHGPQTCPSPIRAITARITTALREPAATAPRGDRWRTRSLLGRNLHVDAIIAARNCSGFMLWCALRGIQSILMAPDSWHRC